MRNTAKITTAVLAAGALTLGLSACGSDKDSASDTSGPLVVAATPVPHAEILNYVKDNLAKKEGLDLEVKEFTDYVTPNTATEDGSVGANYFQTEPYLADFNKKNGTHLKSVASVHLEPLGLYSKKADKVGDLKNGATVALPNDTVTEARALQLLASEGLLTLKDGVGNSATTADITENPKDLEFKEAQAAQTPRALNDVDAAVINGNFALDADLKPAKDALVLESADDNPNVNLLVVKEGQEDDPRVKKLAKLLTSPEVKKFIEDNYAGSVLPSFFPSVRLLPVPSDRFRSPRPEPPTYRVRSVLTGGPGGVVECFHAACWAVRAVPDGHPDFGAAHDEHLPQHLHQHGAVGAAPPRRGRRPRAGRDDERRAGRRLDPRPPALHRGRRRHLDR
ncbi:hypothetical protein SALBM217S_09929 [Streptomyces griseoloalbus]